MISTILFCERVSRLHYLRDKFYFQLRPGVFLNAAFRAARHKLTNVPKDYFYQAVEEILESKRANASNNPPEVERRIVSKEYYDEQVEKIEKSKRRKR